MLSLPERSVNGEINKEEVFKKFPFAFRGNQEEVLGQMVDAINRPEIKFIIGQLPTGSGKSLFSLAFAKAADNSFILTSNKILQDQYVRDFSDHIEDLRGRANYQCATYPGFNCAGSPCRATAGGRGKCKKDSHCGYHKALDKAKAGQTTSMNFAAGIAFLNFTPYFTKRQLLIIDEAHLMPDNLTNFIEFSVASSALSKMLPYGSGDNSSIPKFGTSKEYLPWLQIIKDLMQKREKDFKSGSKIDTMTGSSIKIDEIQSFNRKIATIITEIEENDDNLVVDQSFENFEKTIVRSISFKPVNVSKYAHENLFQFADKTIMLSATIIDYKEFAQSLGVSLDECVFIDAPSTFPKENRPIIRNYVGQLNKGNLEASLPLLARNIGDILKNHSEEKGMIHTHTYDIAKKLVQILKKDYGNRILFPENSLKQAELLAYHSATKEPTVLISPSMTEGVDLKDDLGRFQVIVKVPYPYMGDKVVMARMNKNPNWYSFKTLLTLIQAYGRSTRSETDHSVTYVLDGAFEGLVAKSRRTLPKWFTEAIL